MERRCCAAPSTPPGVADVDGLLALDAELRAVVPFYGPVNDAALCTAAGVDAANSRFLELLSIAGSAEMRRLLAPEAPVVEPPPLRLRIHRHADR